MTMSHPTPKRIPATERLAVALETAGAPIRMIELARKGWYDDWQSTIATPTIALVEDARRHGLLDIANRAIDGEFEAESWEMDEWARSQDTERLIRDLMEGR
jgi:hypothetical protein